MLSQFIQLNVIKSNPNLQRVYPIKQENSKFSLQIKKNTPFPQLQSNQNFRHNKYNRLFINVQNRQICSPDNKQNVKYANNVFASNSQYFNSLKKPLHSFNFPVNVQNSSHKIPLILSPLKQFSLSKQKSKMSKKNSLISSTNNKFLKQSSQQSNIFSKNYQDSSEHCRNYLSLKKPLLKSIKQNMVVSNKEMAYKREQGNQKKFLLKSMSHQNLSPLKYKLLKIPNQCVLQNLNKQKLNQQQKRKLERSDSFRKTIDKSRQKKKIIGIQQQNKKEILNTEYYVTENMEKNAQFSYLEEKQNKSYKTQKVIKNPIKKLEKKLCTPQNIQIVAPLRKKVDSFIEETVNNSNMFPLNEQDSHYMNMQPY